MPQGVTLRARGLYTFQNPLSEIPDGALTQADNVIIDRDGVIGPRRGFDFYGNSATNILKQLLVYKGRMLRHYGSTLDVDSDNAGAFTTLSSSITEVAAGLRIKYREANGNLYFTTNTGIKKISSSTAQGVASASVVSAGGIKALDGTAVLNSDLGFFTQDSIVAYSILWGKKDANNNVIYGVPSSRIEITNSELTLLIRDFNTTINDLVTLVQTGSGPTYTGYASLLIPDNSTAVFYQATFAALLGNLATDLSNTQYNTIKAAVLAITVDSPSATTDQLNQLQAQFNLMVTDLNIDPAITNKTPISGGFSFATQSSTVDLIFSIPNDATVNDFYQIYRSELATSSGVGHITDSNLTPSAEYYLVFEGNPTSAEIASGIIVFHDNVPETFRINSTPLYTNQISGEGILQANEVPPVSTDIESFKGSTFYANTSNKYSSILNLLSVTGLLNQNFIITQGNSIEVYTFVAQTSQVVHITPIAGSQYASSGTADYFDIYSKYTQYRIWFSEGTAIAPAAGSATLVECILTSADSVAVVADKITATLNGIYDFSATVSGTTITVTNTTAGIASAPSQHVAAPGFTISVSSAGTGENAAQQKVGISNAATPAQQVDETTRSLVRVINQQTNGFVNAFYTSGPSDVPGQFELESRTLGSNPFYVATNNPNVGALFNPDLSPTKTITNISATNPTVITSTAHGLGDGAEIIVTQSNSTPSIVGVYAITLIDANSFSIPIAVTGAGSSGFFIPQSKAQISTNDVVPNRLYYSKYQQPEAVPALNYIDIGPKDKDIVRILALRDNLFIMTESAVYRLSGEDISSFQVTLFDSSTQIQAADSASVLNNKIYLLSNGGVSVISDTGTDIMSRPIENLIVPLLDPAYTSFSTATFAFSYESDRSYMLFTVVNTIDTAATVCYRYNTFTDTWVSWDMNKTCGVVNPVSNIAFLGAADLPVSEKERKNYNRTDHSDRSYGHSIPANGINGTSIALGNIFEAQKGDVLIQAQFLTISQYNRLIRKLDLDPGLVDKDYFASIGATTGADLRSKLDDLANKLDNDAGVHDTNYLSAISGFNSTFTQTQEAFNVIVAKLNVDVGVSFTNYNPSTGTVIWEVGIDATTASTGIITVDYAVPFIVGAISIYKKITSTVVWAPHSFNDPSMGKHVYEATILFENDAFDNAISAYSSDLSPGFVSVPINGSGTGCWGTFNFGQVFFGGDSNSRPFRTYVPRPSQRCRYINARFIHDAAREQYYIYGISYTFETTSAKMYR